MFETHFSLTTTNLVALKKLLVSFGFNLHDLAKVHQLTT